MDTAEWDALKPLVARRAELWAVELRAEDDDLRVAEAVRAERNRREAAARVPRVAASGGGAAPRHDGDLGGRDCDRVGGTHEPTRRHAAVVDVVQKVDAGAPRVDVVRVGQPDALPLLATAHLGGGWGWG